MPHNGLRPFRARRFGGPDIVKVSIFEAVAGQFVPRTHNHHPATATFYQGHFPIEAQGNLVDLHNSTEADSA
jgi:hypothetical protein